MSQLSVPVSEDDHIEGPMNAPMTLVEYGDFECPYCAEVFPVIKGVQEKMGENLRFVFRHFPLTRLHPHAEHAAEISEAANTIDRFWDMHDMLFKNQSALDDAHLMIDARAVGLDDESARLAFAGGYADHIKRDFRSGVRSGVNGTPCLFVNGQRYDGPRNVDTIVAALKTISPNPSELDA
ncbi:DsbA family protein [Hyphomicrobium sp. 99]|uniref:DsbA family protein n=1 Tax=Hyphomicrobium sp. 99 TaxID=1163419 RepID=UPI0005F77FC3|nr:DsbA family protein [Hyphomicrobium sp. 99]